MQNRMTGNAFAALLDEIEAYRDARDGAAPASVARPVSGREVFRPPQLRKAMPALAVPAKSQSALLAELREQGEKSRDLANSIAAQTAILDRQLARDRVEAVAARANASARAGRLTAQEAATLDILVNRSRVALG